MAYPIEASQQLGPNQSLTVTFRPAAAGLVSAIVNALGIQPPVDGNGNGGGDGGGGGTSHFRSFTVAVRLEIFKPGASQPVAGAFEHVNVTGPEVSNRVIVAAHTPAVDADLGADWTAKVTNGPADFHAAYRVAESRTSVTVRYQVMPGNLGKVDHILVLMMENRSFDHMLGYLSLPNEGGRKDVDGLTGSEYNVDQEGNRHKVYLRVPPAPNQSSTSFLNDPEHGWDHVAAQLSGDADHVSNAGFVRDFEGKLLQDAQNLPPLRQTVRDGAAIDGGNTRTIAFRPAQPGLIRVESTTQHAPTHSDSGKLGGLNLRRPGSTTVIANSVTAIGASQLKPLEHTATAAELAVPGNWTCEVLNATEVTVEFTTAISYVQEAHDTRVQERPWGVMGYYNAAQLPVYDLFAKSFAVCDQWYASLPTDTWPNRLYALAGGSGGLKETPSTKDVEQDPPGYTLKTIFEVLQEQQVDWRIFFSDLPYALIFKTLAQDATYTARMRGIDELIDRAKTGDLPSFAWVDPNFTDVPDDKNAASDDHPPGDVCRGQRLIARIYPALASSPAWPKTMLIITYDEHGGFYDHALPPGHNSPGPPDDDQTHHVYGLRVPTFVVSPWVEPGSVSKEVYDHTSLLSTILHRFCPASDGSVPSMGQRADAARHVGPMLSADSPQLEAPAPPPVGDCTGAPGAPVDPEAFGMVLQKALFRF